jgi:hypothetical protein
VLFPSLYAVYCDANYFNGVENGGKALTLILVSLHFPQYRSYFIAVVIINRDIVVNI